MASTAGHRDLGRALATWESKRNADNLLNLLFSIPMDYKPTDLSKLLTVLDIFLSQSSQWGIGESNEYLLFKQVECTEGVRLVLLNFSMTHHTQNDDAIITRSLLANMDAICHIASAAIDLITECRRRGQTIGSVDFTDRFIGAALNIAGTLSAWGGNILTPVSDAFCTNRYAERLMTSLWAMNSTTNALCRPGEPPNFLRVENDLQYCHLLNSVHRYLLKPNRVMTL